MDILDILLAQSLSPQGQVDSAVASAQKAAKEAKEAAANINNLNINLSSTSNDNVNTVEFIVNKTDESQSAIIKHYKNVGENEDGTMTQKAIKEYVDEKIIASGANVGSENEDSIVVVGPEGNIQAGDITETSLIRTQIIAGTYHPQEAFGFEVDYENKNFKQLQDENPDNYSLYNGIKRCLVDDNGEIIAFDNDDIYVDNFSTGYQTMVYIPKFYYIRIPIEITSTSIKKEVIMISAINQKGFKVHPTFVRNEEELDYILYSAYEGSTFDISTNAYNRTDGDIDFTVDKLSSITNAKPISGVHNDLTRDNAERLANNRGANWHITDIKIESALQMLFICEYGTLNSQQALGKGVSYITGVLGSNCSSYTGSTVDLGSDSGMATSTTNEIDGTDTIYNSNGYIAVSYRGIENPWGNLRRFINGIEIHGLGVNAGGVPYIDDTSLGFSVPNTSDWISNFGYSNEVFDWVFIPSKAENASSSLPVGDYVDVTENLNGTNVVALGGHWGFKENDGLFNYSFDRAQTYASRAYGARLMYIPTKGTIYDNNIAAWQASIGG